VDVEHAYLILLSSSHPCPSINYENVGDGGRCRGLASGQRRVDGLSPSPSTHQPARP
jgi:hypothetical protein